MLLEKGRYIYDFSLEAHKDIAKTGVNGIIARRYQGFWDQHLQNMLDLDEEIDKFNSL